MIHYIIFPCTPISYYLRGLFPSSFLTITLYALFSSPCHKPCSSHPLQYWHPNNTWAAQVAWLQARRSGVQTSVKGENFWTNVDQPQGSTNFLYNLYNVSFPRGNQPRLRFEQPPLSSTKVECRYSSLLPLLKACMACNRTALPLTICSGQYRSSSSSLHSFLLPPFYLHPLRTMHLPQHPTPGHTQPMLCT